MGTYANFYNSDNGDRVYDADSFSEWLRPFFKTGVFNGELQVLASSGMEVIVDTGNAFIEGKLKKFDSQTTLTVEQASANSTRIDAVVCRRNDTDRDFTLMIVKGTTVAPLPVRENGIYDIVLAHITVPASAVEIKQENITDTRMNADICGWVVSNVEEVDFSQVTAQWADYIANFEADELQAFNEWFDTIKGQLSTDQAGSLQLQIDEQANKIATNTANISANKADITSLQQTTSTNTSDIATNKSDIQSIKTHDDEQDTIISSLEERLYKINDGEAIIENANGGSIRNVKLYGRSLQDGKPTPDNPIEIQSVVNPKLKVCGKNLVDKSIFTFSNKRIFSQTFLEILPNTNYTFSVSNANGTDGVISIYDNDKNLINTYIQNASNPLFLSITTPSNAKYLRIDQWYIGIISSIDDIDIQLELGTVATDYEPYKEQTATLTYTLNAIHVSSGGNITIDGQQYVADYVDIDKKQLVRNVYKETFSSSSKIGESAVSNRYFFEFSPIKKVNLYINKLISNKYEFESDANIAWTSSKTAINIQPSGNIRLYDYNDTVSSDVIYPLETPTIINLTDEELQAFKSLHTYEGITNITDSSEQISGSHKFIYNIADVIDNQCENIDRLNQLKTVTLGTSWTQDTTNGYYTQSVALSGITSKDNPTVDVNLSGTLENMESQQEEWGKILKIETSTDTLTFYASEPTTVSLSVMVKGV